MCSLECTAEEQYQVIADESYDKGVIQGASDTTDLFAWLYANGRQDDMVKAFNDPKYREMLFKEYKASIKK